MIQRLKLMAAILPTIACLLAFVPEAGGTDTGEAIGKSELLRMLGDENVYKRIFAAYNIGARGIDAREKLVTLAGSDNPWMRRAAVFSLGLKADESLLPVLREALSDKNYGVRRAAVVAIGNASNKKCADLLVEALDDSDYGVREMALIATVMNGFKALIPQVVQCLDDKSLRVRRTAAAVLGEFGDKQALPHLQKLMAQIEAGKVAAPDEREVKARLKREGTYPYGFIHFPDLIDKFAADSGLDLRVNDEVLYGLYINAQDPDNLDSVKMKFYSTPTDEALSKICKTLGSYFYVESGTVNIAAKSYMFFDTDLEFEVAVAMYKLGDTSRKKTIERYKHRDIYAARVKSLLK